LGKWGFGWLRQTSMCNHEFVLDLQSDVLQFYYSVGLNEPPEIRITYERPSSVKEKARIIYKVDDNETVFEKNQLLSDLPEQPWKPNSCGPEV
jgi:hypothetical protein